MQKSGQDTHSDQGQRSRDPVVPARGGQRGEGARSAMEQLIQQEKKRDAQLPRENAPPPAPARDA